MTSKQHGSFLSLGIAMMVAGCASPTAVPPTTPKIVAAPPAAQDIATADSDAGMLQSKVTKVTVYSDRARVTRQAAVEYPPRRRSSRSEACRAGSMMDRCRSR